MPAKKSPGLTPLSWALSCALMLSLGVQAEPLPQANGLADLNLQDLMDMEVTSAAKKPQRLLDTDAAIHVITQEDIRRSGATSIPEALRLAPGVNVARISSGLWAVSIRGFNGRFAKNLLVLMDGRTLYTPLFAGIIWETQDTLLEDVERIEVIRGPGAALWGSNAVNGVINIITKKAKDTQGNLVSVSAGDELRFSTSLRHGFKTGDDSHGRLYAKANSRDASQGTSGLGGEDDKQDGLAGFRWDKESSQEDFTLQGQVYRGRLGDTQLVPDTSAPPYFTVDNLTERYSGAHLLGRWERWLDADSELSLQAFLDHTRIEIPRIREERSTLDLEFQHRFPLTEGQDFTWGWGYRRSWDDIRGSATLTMAPSERTLDLYSLFAQDEITLVPDSLRLTLGARLEHNDFTGYEFQPNARLHWRIDPDRSAWLAISRAVRTPSRSESDVGLALQTLPPGHPDNITPAFPLSQVLYGSDQQSSEKLDALDLGYRAQINRHLSLETALYAYHYKDLIGATPVGVVPQLGYMELQLMGANIGKAHVHGLEVAMDWQPADGWRVQPTYSYAHAKVTGAFGDGGLPLHTLSLRVGVDLTEDVQADVWLRHVGKITTAVGAAIPAYTSLDIRLAWQVQKDLELSFVGQNLLDSAHPEYVSDYLNSVPSEIERGYYLKVDWRF